MQYFIKDGTIHRFPVSHRCSAVYTKEQIRDTIPYDVKQCVYCLSLWPADKRKEEGREGSL